MSFEGLTLAQIGAAAGVDYVDSWYERLRGRIYEQFRRASSWDLFCQLLARQAQDLEDATVSTFTVMDIDGSSGVQLDRIGRIVGQPRTVANDATYRSYLKARTLANKSEGTPENLYKVFNALYGALGFIITTSPIKSFTLRVLGAITAQQSAVGVDFLGDAKEAGARGILEWQESPTASLFMFNSGPGFNAGVWADARQA